MRVRPAGARGVHRIAQIGAAAMRAQYEGLVDPVAVESAVAQLYSIDAVADCIGSCSRTQSAEFLVAAATTGSSATCASTPWVPNRSCTVLYVEADRRRCGTGSLLVDDLHSTLDDAHYMLLVVSGNDRAADFYRRHGLEVEALADGLRYYGERMGVCFPAGTPERWRVSRPNATPLPGES